MPRFTAMKASEVQVGRGRASAEARAPFLAALKESDAGRIELERGEKPSTVKRYLQEVSKETGIRVRSGWEDKSQKALVWKRVGK